MMASLPSRSPVPGRKHDREASYKYRPRIPPDALTRTGVVLGEGKTWGASRSKYGIPPEGVLRSSEQLHRLRLGLFSLDPHADISRAVHQRDPFRFAPGQKPHRVAIHQFDLVQIHSEVLLVCFEV